MRAANDVEQRVHSSAAQGLADQGVPMTHTTHTIGVAIASAVDGALRRLVVPVITALAIVAATEESSAQNVERSGKEVVEASCFACHGSGASGAPKIGDKQAWAKRTAQGLTSLTATALKGIRQMPPHGGNLNLTDNEIERAITYMVNQSGGNWTEPISRTARTPERTGEQVVQARCVQCHQTGEGGAPKIGDRAAWIPRVKQGLDVVVRSAIKGHGGMPARGGQADLTDAEMRSAVIYMFNKGTAPPATAATATPAAQAARSDGMHKVIAGTSIDVGLVSAEAIRAAHPQPDAESTMHGGIPSGKGYYHLNVSLRDVATNAEIKDAEVQASVANPLSGSETKKLEPMAIRNTLSYGNYFRMPAKDPYSITVQIRRPGVPQEVEAKFVFRHD
jgi:cytochrome c5